MQREEVPAEEEEKPEAAKQRLPINHPSLADTNLWDYGSEITVGTHTLKIAAPPGKEDQRRFHVDRTSYDVKTAWPTKYTPLPSPTKYVKGARLEQGELMIDLSGQGMEGKVWIPLDKFEAMIHALAEHAEDRIPVTIECFTDKPGDKARKTEKLPLTCVRLQPRAVAATAK